MRALDPLTCCKHAATCFWRCARSVAERTCRAGTAATKANVSGVPHRCACDSGRNASACKRSSHCRCRRAICSAVAGSAAASPARKSCSSSHRSCAVHSTLARFLYAQLYLCLTLPCGALRRALAWETWPDFSACSAPNSKVRSSTPLHCIGAAPCHTLDSYMCGCNLSSSVRTADCITAILKYCLVLPARHQLTSSLAKRIICLQQARHTGRVYALVRPQAEAAAVACNRNAVLLLSGKANATPDGCTSGALSNEAQGGLWQRPPWALPNAALRLQVGGSP